MQSISTRTFLGKQLTSTVDLAGLESLKYFAYTSFTFEKSFISFRNIVVLTTLSKDEPAAERTAFKFSKTKLV